MKRTLFIFRRDFRLQDNLGLLEALKAAEEVVLGFIFTPEQIENNPYRSDRCLQFMIESLEELEKEVSKATGKLYLFYGTPENIVRECIVKIGVEGVFVNRDYTPYSIQRDKKIESVCHQHAIPFKSYHDLLLHPLEETLKRDYHPYTVFTPFFRNASKLDVPLPKQNKHHNYYSKNIPFAENSSIFNKILPTRTKQASGGRKAALEILHHLKTFSGYATERDIPALDKTTHLSAHLKFNTCSVREVYHAIISHLGGDSDLIRSLYWRDFFTSIAFHFPHVFEGAFKTKFNSVKWSNDKKLFKQWCEGRTGFPIVDAGMRELNETGFMHNRLRMITGSFLVKDLHLNWQWGEKYFAQTLIDYDPAVNNGNWQWVASTGCDAQPYFRIFNPWSQSQKFDPDCQYIKKWVPELQSLPSKLIHKWYLEENYSLCKIFPAPIVDHAKEAVQSLARYKKV